MTGDELECRAGPPRVRETLLALAFFAATGLAFLWPALARFGEASFTTADLSQTYALTMTGPMLRPSNAHLSDPVVEMLPWLEFNAQELAAGRLPTWNPMNGAGVPHLANYQSAVFSPFSLCFYLLPLKWALIAAALAKLWVSGLFTWLFLRSLGIGGLAAAAGGVIYQFGGHNVLLLAYPHSSVAACLPLALWAVERTWQAAAGHGRWPRWCAVYGFSVALLLFGGNPETAAFAIASTALYAAARSVAFARARGPRAGPRWPFAARVLGLLAAASLLGLVASAVQVLPFLEYLSRSTLADQRAVGFDGLRSAHWPLQFFPDLFGNPGLRYHPRPNLPYPNYEAANTSYFGPLSWMLALAGLWQCRRRFAAGFFAALAALWILCAHDFEFLRPFMVWFSELTRAPVNRSQLVPLLCLAALAAFGLDALLRGTAPTGMRPRVAAACSAGLILLCLWLARGAALQLAADSYAGNVPSGHALRVPPHMAFMGWIVGLGALAFALLSLARAAWQRGLFAAALLALLWTQSAWVLRPFNALSKDEHVFPRTAAIETLQREIGRERLQVIGEDTLPPQTNMRYGLSTLAVYDALWVREYDRLYRALFATESNWRESFSSSARAAGLFGARYLLARDQWPRWNPGVPIDGNRPLAPTEALALAGGSVLEQSFVAGRDGLDRVALALGAENDPRPAFARLSLIDPESGVELASRTLDTHSLRASLPKRALPLFAFDARYGSPTGWVRLEFEPVANSAGRTFVLRLSAEPGEWQHGFIAWTTEGEGQPLPAASLDGATLTRRLCFDFQSDATRDLEVAAEFEPFTLYRVKRSPGRFWLADGVVPAADAEAAFAAVTSGDFDPWATTVLEGIGPQHARPAGGTAALAPRVLPEAPSVLEESPHRVRLACNAAADTWLVASLSWYPGWHATVDGVPVEIVKANYAFLAVPLPRGAREVLLEFDSASVRLGAWMSAIGLCLLAILALFPGRSGGP